MLTDEDVLAVEVILAELLRRLRMKKLLNDADIEAIFDAAAESAGEGLAFGMGSSWERMKQVMAERKVRWPG